MAFIDEEELADLKADNRRLREVLAEYADWLGEHGCIPNTPAGKRAWMDGEISDQKVSAA
jgi:hypothetical protein